jgi:DNA-binding CsgD family transcriptional regulator
VSPRPGPLTNVDAVPADRQLAGRTDELKLIAEFVRRVGQSGEALVLLGEAGVGKTALLDAGSEEASRVGIRVLRAAGVEFEADVTFSALHQVLDPIQQWFAHLCARQRNALNAALGLGEGHAAERLVVSTAALTLLRLVASDRPVLLVVDDLPWVDRSSANVLGFVARRLEGSRVGFLAAARSEEDRVFDRAGLPSVQLEPLDEQASDELLNLRFPTLAARSRRTVLEIARGNPLTILEYGFLLSRPDGAVSWASGPVLPQSRQLEKLFTTEIEQLPDSSRRLLLMMALDGSGDLRILQGAAAGTRLRRELAVAERARLISVDGSTQRFEFRHPLIRAAAVHASTDPERRRAHATLAELLEHDPDRHAWHLAGAAAAPDERAASQLEHAARRSLSRGDPVGAVAALTHAARLTPGHANRGRRLAAAAFIGADASGGLRDVPVLLADAGETGVNSGASLQTAAAAAFVLCMGDGDVDTAHALLVGAIEHAAETGDAMDAALEDALNTLLRVCFFGGRAELWESFDRAISHLPHGAPELVEIRAKTLGDPVRRAAEALPRLDTLINELTGEADPTRIVRIATASAHVDRLPACRHALWRVVRYGREGGAVSSGISGLILLALDDWSTGDWDAAEDACDEAARLCEAHGYATFESSGRRTQALIAAARGDSARVRSLTEAMLQWAAPRRVRAVEWGAWQARALDALGRGDFEEAYQEVTKITPAGVTGSHNPSVLWSALDLVEAAARSGHHAEAAAHADALVEARIGTLSSRLALIEKGSAAIAADDSAAITLFEEALAVSGVQRWPFDLARIELAFGERLRRARAGRQSRLHLNAALQTFERLGARPWAARAANELRASGQASRARESDRDALTPQERDIAELAAAGLTNKEIAQRLFLSHRTVGGHLHRLFPKLGVTSRAALRDALASLEAHDETVHATVTDK